MRDTAKQISFGIEIEVKGSFQAAGRAIETGLREAGRLETTGTGGYYARPRVTDNEGRVWKVVGDGSLGRNGCEVVSPVLRWDDMECLQQIVRALRRNGCRVDSDCGIHVHVDGAGFDAKSVRNLVRTVSKYEPMLLKGLGVSPARRSQWCRDVNESFLSRTDRMPRGATLDDLATRWYGGRNGSRREHYHHSRYHGVNLHALWYHGTIEFRYFDATLHAGKVRSYVTFCLALAAYAQAMKSSSRRRRTTEKMNTGTAWYWFLWYQLQLKGADNKAVRQHLTANFTKDEMRRKDRRAAAPSAEAVFSDPNYIDG
jgi:hypothetical protein